MMKFVFSLIALFGLGIGAAEAADAPKPYADVKDPENTLLLKLKDGDVLIQMFPEDAPNHVARIKELVRQGFYDGLKFHRVIDGFMAQTGDPLGNGTGGSGKNLKAEFNNRPHKRGAVSMARAADPNSAGSRYHLEKCTWLQCCLGCTIRIGFTYHDSPSQRRNASRKNDRDSRCRACRERTGKTVYGLRFTYLA